MSDRRKEDAIYAQDDYKYGFHDDVESLIDIARLSEKTVRFFNHEPVMAMVSYSNFGSDKDGSAGRVHEAVGVLQERYPDWDIDGEMQIFED